MTNRRIQHPKEVVKEGDVVPVKLVRIEKDRHRLGLSLRQARNDAEAMGFVVQSRGRCGRLAGRCPQGLRPGRANRRAAEGSSPAEDGCRRRSSGPCEQRSGTRLARSPTRSLKHLENAEEDSPFAAMNNGDGAETATAEAPAEAAEVAEPSEAADTEASAPEAPEAAVEDTDSATAEAEVEAENSTETAER